MITYESRQSILPSKRKLILLSSLAITVFFTLPRLGFWRRVQNMELNVEFEWIDFALRSGYIFVIAVLFFWINLEIRTIKLGWLRIDLDKWLHRLALNFILLILVNGILIRIHLLLFDPHLHDQLFRALFAGSNTLVVVFTILGSYIYNLVFRNHQVKMDNQRLQKQNAEARYDALKNQLNPHFLFNSFNTLTSLILSSPGTAVDFVNDMSDVYRYVLKNSSQKLVTLEEELQFLDAYADVLRNRHTGKLTIEIDVDPALQTHCILPMALQIPVENAIKHNVVSRTNPLHIRVRSNQNREIAVSNNLQKRGAIENSTGLGLYNLNQRYHYLGNKEISIKESPETFTVTIPLLPHEDTDH